MPDEPDLPADAGELRELLGGLRAAVKARDAENAALLAELAAGRELRRRLELKVAELERQLGSDCLLTEQRPVFPQFSGRVAASVDTVPGHDQRGCS